MRARGVVHVKSSWRGEEVYVASGNHFTVAHGTEGVCLCVQTCCLYLSCRSLRAYRVCMCCDCVYGGVYIQHGGLHVYVCA